MSDLDKLREFVLAFNSGILAFNAERITEMLPTYSTEVAQSYLRQFASSEKRTHIGLSEIGKPAVLLGLKKLGAPQEDINPASRLRFHLGDVFESLIVQILKASGYHISHTQETVEFEGMPGHIDGVYGDYVIEIKTMSDRYFKQFVNQPDDERGYLTQLNLYSKLMNKHGVWICLNKSTYELALVEMIPNVEVIDRARNVIQALNEVKTIDDVFDFFDPPQPVEEWFKKQPTGKYLLPDSMKYTPYRNVFYALDIGLNGYKKETVYVVSFQERKIGVRNYESIIEPPF